MSTNNIGISSAANRKLAGKLARNPCILSWILNLKFLNQLDNIWEHFPDSDMIQNVLIDLQWPVALRSVKSFSALCCRCNSLQLWSMACSFIDTLEGLKRKRFTCALCHLLWVGIEGSTTASSIRSQDTIVFSRFGTYLMSNLRPERPIACLFTTPGKVYHAAIYVTKSPNLYIRSKTSRRSAWSSGTVGGG